MPTKMFFALRVKYNEFLKYGLNRLWNFPKYLYFHWIFYIVVVHMKMIKVFFGYFTKLGKVFYEYFNFSA